MYATPPAPAVPTCTPKNDNPINRPFKKAPKKETESALKERVNGFFNQIKRGIKESVIIKKRQNVTTSQEAQWDNIFSAGHPPPHNIIANIINNGRGKFIKNEKYQLRVVKDYIYNFLYLKNPHPSVIKYAEEKVKE